MSLYRLYKILPLGWLGRAYASALWNYPKIANYTRTGGNWRVASAIGDTMILKNGDITLTADRYHGTILLFESLSWKELYLPEDGVKSKTVLDIGVGCGESAAFFFENRAKRVVGIERNKKCAQNAMNNAKVNGWDFEVIAEPFKLEHLDIPHDFLKMDIEGAEKALLRYDEPLGPCRLEIHCTAPDETSGLVPGPNGMSERLIPEVRDAIVRKFGLTRIKSPGTEMWGRDR